MEWTSAHLRLLRRWQGEQMRAVLAMVVALLGCSAVGLGAFGAHALALDERGQRLWSTASLYHLVHAAAMVGLAVAARREPTGPWGSLALAVGLGTLLFSGSLYGLALGAPRWVGAITPVGGLVWMGAWLAVGWAFFRPPIG